MLWCNHRHSLQIWLAADWPQHWRGLVSAFLEKTIKGRTVITISQPCEEWQALYTYTLQAQVLTINITNDTFYKHTSNPNGHSASHQCWGNTDGSKFLGPKTFKKLQVNTVGDSHTVRTCATQLLHLSYTISVTTCAHEHKLHGTLAPEQQTTCKGPHTHDPLQLPWG